jgi:hypothetical protein
MAAPLRLGASGLGVAVAGPLHRMQPNEAKTGKRLLQCIRRLEQQDVR